MFVKQPKPNAQPRTFGPVPDLERHLPAEWWRTLFNSVYIKTDGDVVENEKITRGEVDDLIRVTGAEPNDRILDLCCGQGRHCLELASRGFTHVTGVDRSRYLVRLARQRAKKANLEVTFKEGDARKFPWTWEWIDKQHFVCRERSLSADGERLVSREVVTHAEKGVIIDPFYAERLYSRDVIKAHLERCGFQYIRS